jgi:modulator of FtsH protease HflK
MPWSNQGGGGPWGSGNKGPWGSGPQQSGPPSPDLEEFLRRSQDRLRTVLPGGNFGGRGIVLAVAVAAIVWSFTGVFTVNPDELGIVLRFGAYSWDAKPGLHYHWPYPIETALTPKVTRVQRIDIGMRAVDDLRRGSSSRDIPEESLMLTGDENIVDVDFTVLWLIKPDGAGDFLFNIYQPEVTVKAVAESAMREVIGHLEVNVAAVAPSTPASPAVVPAATTASPGSILNAGRGAIESQVQEIMQKTLDGYGAGIMITQVQLQKVDPPSQVIDSFRDVQAALADAESAQNKMQAYANQVVPEARGNAAKITQSAEAYREQTVAEATGQAARFLKVYEEYKKAPDVTRERMYLETMERLFGGTDKIILDSGGQNGGGVVPYLPLDQLTRPQGGARPATPGSPTQQSASPTGGNR